MSRVAVGDMRERVTIQRPAETRDGAGQVSRTWPAVATVHAKVETADARETYQARQVGSLATHVVTVWYRADLADAGPKWRLVHRGRVFAIDGVRDPDARRRVLVLTCYATGAADG